MGKGKNHRRRGRERPSYCVKYHFSKYRSGSKGEIVDDNAETVTRGGECLKKGRVGYEGVGYCWRQQMGEGQGSLRERGDEEEGAEVKGTSYYFKNLQGKWKRSYPSSLGML